MDVVVIGTGTAVPSVRRSSPCVLVHVGQTCIVCDTGPGALRQLCKAGVSISSIDYLVYSHLHIDHTADFAPFLFSSNYDPANPRTRDITVIGPTGFQTFYEKLCAVYGTWIIPHRFSLLIHDINSKPFQGVDCVIKVAPVKHTDTSIAVRIEDNGGGSVVYSGDTDYCTTLVNLATGAKLLILESSFPEHMKRTGHLTPSLAGRIAREAQCQRLMLTHFYPACDAADILTPLRKEYSGEVVIAEDFSSVRL